MPIFEQGADPLRDNQALAPERAPIGPAPDMTPQFAPSFLRETVPAAFRQENPVLAAASLMDAWTSQSRDREFDPEHNPLATIKGTWAEARPELFLGSPNEATTRAMIAQGERENRDRETLQAAGIPGVAAAMAAGLLDPTLAIIPAGFARGAARSAAQAGALGALQAGVSEGALYASQVTRTKEEALHAVASGAVLSGVLGAAIGHLAPAERAAAEKALDDMRPFRAPEASASLSAAEADTRSMQQVKTGVKRELEALSPAARVITGESVPAKRAVTELVDTARRFEQEEAGAPKSLWGGSVETVNRLDKAKFELAARDTLQSLWAKHYYEGAEPPKFSMARQAFDELRGATPADKMSYGDFKEAVFDAAYSGDVHPIEEVAQAAAAIRRDVLEPIAERAKTTLTQDGTPLLDPDTIAPKGDRSFIPRIWDHPTIIARRNEFRDTITKWLVGEQDSKRLASERIRGLKERLALAEEAEDAERIAQIRTALEEEFSAWEGKSAREIKAALKERDAALAERAAKMEAGEYRGKGGRLTSADAALDRAVERVLGNRFDYSTQELASRADEIIDRILSTPDGRLPYDIASGGPRVGATDKTAALPRGSLHSRDFAIPTALVRDFVVRDMEHVVSSHLRTLLPDIELTRRFGDADMTAVIKGIREDYNRKIAELGNTPNREKEAKRLHDAADADIRDVAAMRDRVRNVYGWTGDATGRTAHNLARDVRNWVSLASLGGSTVNSFTDFGVNAVFRYGLGTVFREQWAPFVKSLAGLSDVSATARKQAREMGIGVETALGLARHNFGDVVDNYKPGNKFSRGLSWAADRLHMVNLLGPWTDYSKIAAWVPAQAEFGRAASRIAAGKGTKKDISRMADASIPLPVAKRIAAQIEKHGQDVDGVRFANAGAWDDKEAQRVFEAAMNREVEILVTTPGHGDKPLWLSTPVGSVVGQFKTFMAGAHEKVLISNLQKRDADTVQGVVAALGMGAISYALYSLGSGQKPSERPQDWIKEAIDRAAMTGWFGEESKVLAKLTGGMLDPYKIIGADRPLTRRANNSGLAELLGPGFSLAEGAALAGKHAFAGDFQGADLHRLRKAAPLQNLTGFRKLLDQIEDGASSAWGLKPRSGATPTWEQ